MKLMTPLTEYVISHTVYLEDYKKYRGRYDYSQKDLRLYMFPIIANSGGFEILDNWDIKITLNTNSD